MSATATPATCKVTATAKPAIVTPIKIVTATAMGPSGYREEFGVLTDAQIVDAVRASFGSTEFTLTDEQIVGAIGWALTVRTAITKVTALLTA
jgi:hypothetical protein